MSRRSRWPRIVRAVARRMRRHRSLPIEPARGSSACEIINSYQLVLGREPEPDALLTKASHPIREALAILLDSDEFAERVRGPILRGKPPTVDRPIPSGALIDWVRTALPISRAGRRRLRSIRTWQQLIWVVLSDPSFRNFPLSSRWTWREPDFLSALRNRAQGPSRFLVGAVDLFDGARISGWALDANDPERRLPLEVHAEGMVVGVGEASAMRVDIRDICAVSGFCGFTIDVSSAQLYLSDRSFRVEVREAGTGHPIGERAADTNPVQPPDAVPPLGAEAGEPGETISYSASAEPFPTTSYPLEAYSTYYRCVYEGAAPTRWRDAPRDGPGFGLVALIEGDAQRAERTLRSIVGLNYGGWDLTLVGEAALLRDDRIVGCVAAADPARIRSVELDPTRPVGELLNDAAIWTGGDFLIFADGVRFAPDALDHLAAAVRANLMTTVLYWDDDEADLLDPAPRHLSPRLKNPFDPVWLLQHNYIGGTFAINRELFKRVGGFRNAVGGVDHHDLLLRATAQAGRAAVRHIPRVLHSRPAGSGSGRSSLAAVSDHLQRTGWPAFPEARADVAGGAGADILRIRPQRLDDVSAVVIIASRDKPELLGPCVSSLLATRAGNSSSFGVTIVDHASVRPDALAQFERLRADGLDVRRYDGSFNWAAINNFGAEAQAADVLVFLNDDTLALAPGWCDELCLHAMRLDVGAVGARLLYPDNSVQHAGMLLHGDGAAWHEGMGHSVIDDGYLGRFGIARDVAAVTGACLATRRALFEAHGGFDARNFPVTFNDVDYCVRLREAGLAVRYTPYAEFYHFESKSRGADVTADRRARHESERRIFAGKWPRLAERDPFYNAHFDRHAPPHRRLLVPSTPHPPPAEP